MPKPTTREAILANVVHILRDERIQKQLSMNALAARAGLHVSMISLVERQLRNPTLDALLRIAEVLEVDFWRIIKKATEKAKSGK